MSSAQKDISRRHLLTGAAGEDVAVSYLQKAGYRILQRNYRTRIGEIDVIAREGDTLVFVEVKTRSGRGFGLPQAAVDYKKQSKITRVALTYLSQKKEMEMHCRFDIVAVWKQIAGFQVELIRNAFEMAL